MNNHYLYLLINLLVILVPFIASFYPKYPFYKEWKFVFPSLLIVAIFFIVWDVYFTKIGVWGFNDRYIIGKKLFSLPIEEIMFFFFIPYSCTFTYYSIKILLPKNQFFIQHHNKITNTLLVITPIVAIVFYHQYYTVSTFAFLFLFMLIIKLQRYNFAYFYLSFCFIIFFFLVTNGILTGSFIDEPVVGYNNQENLSIRLGTIPLEDFFYGFLMCGFNVRLYEYFKKRKSLRLTVAA